MTMEHTIYSLDAATTQSLIHSVYKGVLASSVVRFVTDAGDANKRSTDTGGVGTYNTGTIVYTDWGTDSFMVVEPVAAYPGGGRWQAKIRRNSTTVLSIEVDFAGTWNNHAFTSPTALKTAGPALAGYTTTAAATAWKTAATTPAIADTVDVTASDSDGYTYLRVMVRQPGQAENGQYLDGFYVGGYIPCKPASDTKPACMLIRAPRLGNGQTYYWGNNAATNASRTPVEYAHTTMDLTTAGSCWVQGINNLALTVFSVDVHTCEGGEWVDTPLYLMRGTNVVGSFGQYTMRCGSIARSDGVVSADGKWIIANDTIHRIAV